MVLEFICVQMPNLKLTGNIDSNLVSNQVARAHQSEKWIRDMIEWSNKMHGDVLSYTDEF